MTNSLFFFFRILLNGKANFILMLCDSDLAEELIS